MPTERLCMRHTREILRHKWLLGSSHHLVTSSLAVSHGAITDTTQRAVRAGLDWDSVCALADSELEQLLYPPPPSAGTLRPEPDFVTIDLALHPEGYRRSSFCAHYETWKKTRGLTMRQVHQGGDKLFVDYSGLKAYYIDPTTGDSVACELFVATLGTSSYTYAESSRSQQVPDFLASHVRALAFFGGVPAAVVSDQLRSGVSRPCRYEPGPNTSYLDFAQHYGTVLLPARPRSPRCASTSTTTSSSAATTTPSPIAWSIRPSSCALPRPSSRRSTTASAWLSISAASSEVASPPSWNICRRVTRDRPRSRRRRFSSGLATSGQ